jgi:small subunit ribosomal protein S2
VADQPEKEKTWAQFPFTMRQLLEAGVHFGHQTHRWNPKMQSFIYGSRNGIHIVDLSQTVPLLHQALNAISDTVAKGGRVLFVGTKRSAQEQIAEAAKRSAQYYVNSRWLGGMLTNWKTISNSIKHLRSLDEIVAKKGAGLTKRELLSTSRASATSWRRPWAASRTWAAPDILFVIDTNKEQIAIKEANRLGIPVVAIIDTNSDPAGITYPIPGNDDAARAVALYCDLVTKRRASKASRLAVGFWRRPRRRRSPDRRDGRRAISRREHSTGSALARTLMHIQEKDDMAEITAALVKRSARENRRWHDGLQGSPGRHQRRHGSCR